MTLSAFQLTSRGLIPLATDASNPDEFTRRLPRGLYTTFSTNSSGTRVLGLSAHLDRLYAPAGGVTPSVSRAELKRALAKLAQDSAPGESRFRLLLSASDGMFYLIRQPFTPLGSGIYERGVKAITADLTRHDPRRKDSSFITESQVARTQVGGEIFEVLLAKGGRIYEGMTSNFFVIASPKGEAISSPLLLTARRGILLGVTRRAVLRLARAEGLEILYRSPRLSENYAEAFLTSSSRGIVPIISINDNRVGQGSVGSWTTRLIAAYRAYVEEHSQPISPSP